MTVANSCDSSGLFDVVLVSRPRRWRPTDTHDVPQNAQVIGVEAYGVDQIEADDIVAEINSSDWLREWAIITPHIVKQPIVVEPKHTKRCTPSPSCGVCHTDAEVLAAQ